jgi:hypothetical protein
MNTGSRYETNRRLYTEHPRIMGALMSVLGSVLIYLCLIGPILDAESGAESVSLSMGGSFLGLASLLMGLLYLIGGARFVKIFHPAAGESKMPGYIIGAIIGIVTLVAFLAIKSYVIELGYTF